MLIQMKTVSIDDEVHPEKAAIEQSEDGFRMS
jgi:hypothetical protein